MRGYFGVGVEGVSKPMNLGNLVRIAHAFDASFFFSVAPRLKLSDANSDTSNAEGALPFYALEEQGDFKRALAWRGVGGGGGGGGRRVESWKEEEGRKERGGRERKGV